MLNRDSILAAAWHCFDDAGEAGLSLRRVAAQLSVTPMALYRHVTDKQGLVDLLVIDALDDWRAQVAAIPPGLPDRWLASIAERYLDFALSRPRRFEAAFLLTSSVALRYPDDFLAGRSSAGALQLDLLQQAAGPLSRDGLGERLVALTALAQGLVTLHRSGRIAGGEAGFRALFQRQVALFLSAVRTREPA